MNWCMCGASIAGRLWGGASSGLRAVAPRPHKWRGRGTEWLALLLLGEAERRVGHVNERAALLRALDAPVRRDDAQGNGAVEEPLRRRVLHPRLREVERRGQPARRDMSHL